MKMTEKEIELTHELDLYKKAIEKIKIAADSAYTYPGRVEMIKQIIDIHEATVRD